MPATYFDVEGLGSWEWDGDSDAMNLLLSCCTIAPRESPTATKPAILDVQSPEEDVWKGMGRGKLLEDTNHRDNFLRREIRRVGSYSYSNAEIEENLRKCQSKANKDSEEDISEYSRILVERSEKLTFKSKKKTDSEPSSSSSFLSSPPANGSVYNDSEDSESLSSYTLYTNPDKEINTEYFENRASPGLTTGKESDYQLDSDLESIVSNSNLRVDAPEFQPQKTRALQLDEVASPKIESKFDESGAGEIVQTLNLSKRPVRTNQNALLAALEANNKPHIRLQAPEEFLPQSIQKSCLSNPEPALTQNNLFPAPQDFLHSKNLEKEPSTALLTEKSGVSQNGLECLPDSEKYTVNEQYGHASIPDPSDSTDYPMMLKDASQYTSYFLETCLKYSAGEVSELSTTVEPEVFQDELNEFLLSEAVGGGLSPIEENYNVMHDPSVDLATKKLISELLANPDGDPIKETDMEGRYESMVDIRKENHAPARNPFILTPTDFVINQSDFPPLQ